MKLSNIDRKTTIVTKFWLESLEQAQSTHTANTQVNQCVKTEIHIEQPLIDPKLVYKL